MLNSSVLRRSCDDFAEMVSDEEMESFEITEEDLLRELNPYGKRRKFTKEDAIYGVWAEHDSDEEYEGKGRSRRSKDKDDYISMLSFVAATKEDGSSGEEIEDDVEINEAIEETPQAKKKELPVKSIPTKAMLATDKPHSMFIVVVSN